jgi:glutamate racemase
MKVGVFDSGVGGQSVANAISKAMPEHEVLVRDDRANLPYGNKTKEQLLTLVPPIFDEMIANGCQVIVVACNTVTTTIIAELKQRFPGTTLIGVEPMIKPAAEQTLTNVIAVCATPATLKSDRYRELKDTYASNVHVLEPDCSDWASMIEDKAVNEDKISQLITRVLEQGADQVVLACTHYHWIEEDIIRICQGRAHVLQPEAAIVRRLIQALEQLA